MCTRKTRILDVVYNASNNELVRTKTLVKNAIVVVSLQPPPLRSHARMYGVGYPTRKRHGSKKQIAPKCLYFLLTSSLMYERLGSVSELDQRRGAAARAPLVCTILVDIFTFFFMLGTGTGVVLRVILHFPVFFRGLEPDRLTSFDYPQ